MVWGARERAPGGPTAPDEGPETCNVGSKRTQRFAKAASAEVGEDGPRELQHSARGEIIAFHFPTIFFRAAVFPTVHGPGVRFIAASLLLSVLPPTIHRCAACLPLPQILFVRPCPQVYPPLVFLLSVLATPFVRRCPQLSPAQVLAVRFRGYMSYGFVLNCPRFWCLPSAAVDFQFSAMFRLALVFAFSVPANFLRFCATPDCSQLWCLPTDAANLFSSSPSPAILVSAACFRMPSVSFPN